MEVLARKGRFWKIVNGKRTEISVEEYTRHRSGELPPKMRSVFGLPIMEKVEPTATSLGELEQRVLEELNDDEGPE